MRASAFEFRWRFFILLIIFWGCFWASSVESHGHLGYFWILLTAWMSKLDRLSNETNSLILKTFVCTLVVVAAGIRTWAAAYLHTSVVQDRTVQSGRVVAAGPYAYLRNPLYAATILLALALAPMNGPLEALALVLMTTLFELRLIGREELELTAAQGETYSAYKAAVPSLLPRFTHSQVVKGNARPQWGQAFLGEALFWAMVVGVVLYSVTFRSDWLVRAALIGLGLNFIFRGLMVKPTVSSKL